MAKSKRSNEQNIGEALQEWLKRYRLQRGFNDANVLQAWDAVLGPSIAKQTLKKKFQNGVLFVQLENSVVRDQLLMVRTKIVASLNEHLGRNVVKEVQLF